MCRSQLPSENNSVAPTARGELGRPLAGSDASPRGGSAARVAPPPQPPIPPRAQRRGAGAGASGCRSTMHGRQCSQAVGRKRRPRCPGQWPVPITWRVVAVIGESAPTSATVGHRHRMAVAGQCRRALAGRGWWPCWTPESSRLVRREAGPGSARRTAASGSATPSTSDSACPHSPVPTLTAPGVIRAIRG